MLTREQAWKVLEAVPDPEIPVISVTELGIVREIDEIGEVDEAGAVEAHEEVGATVGCEAHAGAHPVGHKARKNALGSGDAAGRQGLRVIVTPTYSGCPATEVIADSIRTALLDAGALRVEVETRLSPAWTTDWITADARDKLRAYGIVPPGERAANAAQPVRFMRRQLACPRCASTDTERLSEFGSTACKATYRCKSCLEPFEYFKPI